MIVMDLEWNRSYDRKRLDEILQIGAVRVAGPGGPILSTFNVFIRPRVHKRFDPGARKLPDLQESIDSRTTFAEAWAAFLDWCGDESDFAFWGPDDFGVIRQNCTFWGLPVPEPERVYNYQRAFAHACGTPTTMMALWRVVDYLGIPDVFDYHNALYDAAYTAFIGAWLRREDLDYVPPKRVKRPPQPRRKKTQSAEAQPADKPSAEGGAAAGEKPPKAAKPKKRPRRRRRRKAKTAGQTAPAT